jgi:hypothetical protein
MKDLNTLDKVIVELGPRGYVTQPIKQYIKTNRKRLTKIVITEIYTYYLIR